MLPPPLFDVLIGHDFVPGKVSQSFVAELDLQLTVLSAFKEQIFITFYLSA